MRDDDVRSACFAALDVLQATWGADVPYAALAEGFNFRGQRVPFLNKAYGIYRSRAQSGPAALSVNSSPKQIRYRDEQTPDGVLYRYQGDNPDTTSTAGSGARTCSKCRSSTSSARGRTGTGRSTPRTSSGTSLPSSASS